MAEVLITLGIIGAAASLTMPALIGNHQKQVILNSLKANYSLIQQAITSSQNDNFDLSNVSASADGVSDWFTTYLQPYIKTIKVCYNKAGCWHNSGNTKHLNGGVVYLSNGAKGVGGYALVTATLPNGTNLSIDWYGTSSMSNIFGYSTTKTTIVIYLDVNGNKGPNVVGKDIFVVVNTPQGVYPLGFNKTPAEVQADCSKNGKGYYCLQYIIQNGWQMPDDYPW